MSNTLSDASVSPELHPNPNRVEGNPRAMDLSPSYTNDNSYKLLMFLGFVTGFVMLRASST